MRVRVSGMIIRYGNFLTALFVLSVHGVSPASDEVTEVKEGVRCINSRAIRRTDVVDDSNIIFHMHGTKIYLNTFPRACRGLSRDGRFTYVTYTRSLCELDRVNVLQDSGLGAIEGRACKLGRFRLVTEKDIAHMFEQMHRLPEARQVEPPAIEDVLGDDAAENDER